MSGYVLYLNPKSLFLILIQTQATVMGKNNRHPRSPTVMEKKRFFDQDKD